MSELLEYVPPLARGTWVTIQITSGGAAIAAVCAFIAGLAGTSRHRAVRGLARTYVDFFRGTSVLVQLFWLFFALPLLGFALFPLFAGMLALGLNVGAYGAEVVHGAVNAVPQEQREAAVALNFSAAQRMRQVILPQAVPEMLPSFGNLLIELLKGTALVSIITVMDLAFIAQQLRSASGNTGAVYAAVLVIYFVLAYTLTLGMRFLERRARAHLHQSGPSSVSARAEQPT